MSKYFNNELNTVHTCVLSTNSTSSHILSELSLPEAELVMAHWKSFTKKNKNRLVGPKGPPSSSPPSQAIAIADREVKEKRPRSVSMLINAPFFILLVAWLW